MPSIAVLNGPNLNLLGTRRPEIYGHTTLDELRAQCEADGERHGLAVDFRQTNHEGQLVDWIQETGAAVKAGGSIGAVLNAGALTHYAWSLHDAIEGAGLPVIEVHISNVHARDEWRHRSVISPVARGVVVGFGILGYSLAIDGLCRLSR